MIPAVRLLITLFLSFSKLIIFISCSFKDSQNVFINFLPLHTSYLFSLSLNNNIVDIEKPYGVCSLTFVVDDFSGLILHQPIFPIEDSRFA